MHTQINTQTRSHTLLHMQTQASLCPSVCPQRSFYGSANRRSVLTAGLLSTMCLHMLVIITPCVLLTRCLSSAALFTNTAFIASNRPTLSQRLIFQGSFQAVQVQLCSNLHFYPFFPHMYSRGFTSLQAPYTSKMRQKWLSPVVNHANPLSLLLM